MDQFSYLSVLLSLIVGLAITQVLRVIAASCCGAHMAIATLL